MRGPIVEVAGWLEEAEALDIAEDERYGEDDGRELPKWMKNKRERLAKIREAKAALEREAGAVRRPSARRKPNGRQAREVSADAGYCSEENLAVLPKRHIRGCLAAGRRKHGTASATSSRKPAGPLRRAMATRPKRGGHRNRYRLRKHTVEPVLGQIKEAQGIRRFLLRGFEKVGLEWQLICASHNLRKLTKAMA